MCEHLQERSHYKGNSLEGRIGLAIIFVWNIRACYSQPSKINRRWEEAVDAMLVWALGFRWIVVLLLTP
jgi:hypothetical protein